MNTGLVALLIVSIVNYTPFMIQKQSLCADVNFYNPVYDDDYFGDILNIFDSPVCETLNGVTENWAKTLDGDTENWAKTLDGDTENWAKLGPIPSEEILRVTLAPVGGGTGGMDCVTGGGGDSADSFPESCVINDAKSQRIYKNIFKSRQKSFEAPSPDSVLEQRSASSAGKPVSFNTEISIPVRTRTKRSRSTLTDNPWSKSTLPIPLQKGKKKRRNIKISRHVNNEMKKCSHCEITKTPQWREGPMGPKTLCNACGVRYRSGRLFPEYRPAASPSFVPNLHSNSHRKVIEMRQKGGGMNDDDDDDDDDDFRKYVLSLNVIDT